MKKDLNYHLALPYKIEIVPIPEDEGVGFLARLPQFGVLGIVGDGGTKEEALADLAESRKDRFRQYLEEGLEIPEPNVYIDDNMTNATSSAYTPLTHIGFGKIMDLTDNSITTDGLIKMVPNGQVGLEINPNLDQELTFTVVSNTENTITVDTASGLVLTDVAATGDAYAGVYRFDNVYFRRGGFLVLGDRLVVTDTLRVDEYGRVTHYDATLHVESRLEMSGAAVAEWPSPTI